MVLGKVGQLLAERLGLDAPSTVGLNDEGEEKGVFSRRAGQVFAVLGTFPKTSCCKGSMRRDSTPARRRGMNNRDINVAEYCPQGKADVCVLIIRVVHLEARLEPGPSSSHLNDAGKNLGDLVVALVDFSADVLESMVRVNVHALPTVAHGRQLLRRWVLCTHSCCLHARRISKHARGERQCVCI